MNLSGNTILITGGGKGLGLALAKAFAAEQNTVILCDNDRESLDQAVQHIEGSRGIVCDISDSRQRGELFEEISSRFPETNILVNNAATCMQLDFSKPVPAGKIETEITTNLTAPVDLIRLFLPQFLEKPRAAILNICSECGIRPFYSIPVYSGSKAGLVFFTESLRNRLRHQLGNTNLLIAEVYPPTIDTHLNAQWPNVKKVSPDIVAERILEGMRRDNAVIWTKHGEVRIMHTLSRWLTSLLRAPRKLVRSGNRLLRGKPIAW